MTTDTALRCTWTFPGNDELNPGFWPILNPLISVIGPNRPVDFLESGRFNDADNGRLDSGRRAAGRAFG
jgi:hypothetical protein